MATMVQGVWSASVRCNSPIEKTLYADAGSGVIFNLSGSITLDNEVLSEGVIMLPIKDTAGSIILEPGAKIAGIRFHPAAGYAIMKQHYPKPTLLLPEKDNELSFYQIYNELLNKKDNDSKIEAIYRWAALNLNTANTIPDDLRQALKLVSPVETQKVLSARLNISQRQIERYFKVWVGITPKHYQRILRTKAAMDILCMRENSKLADVACQFGYSDQAHMTREFKKITGTTPGRI